MKLIEIIEALRTDALQNLLNKNSVALEYEFIDIYAEYVVGIESDYYFFNANEIPQANEFERNGIKYENLCSLSTLNNLVLGYAKLNDKRAHEALLYDILDYLENGVIS